MTDDVEGMCNARWFYRGGTRAKCHAPAGHTGKHHNGTVSWSDQTESMTRQERAEERAIAAQATYRATQLERLLQHWFPPAIAADVTAWIVEDPEGVADACNEADAGDDWHRPVEDVATGGRL